MYAKKEINLFLNNYFNDNFEESPISIIDTSNGYQINMGSSELIYVEEDSVLGWHCYGDIYDNNLAEKIENDLESYFEIINEKYYINNAERG